MRDTTVLNGHIITTTGSGFKTCGIGLSSGAIDPETKAIPVNITEESLTPRFVGTAEAAAARPSRLVDLIVAAAAVLGRLPALGAWWNQDDWGLLGRAAGLVPGADFWPARILSQKWYWDLTWPWLGTQADAHAVIRIMLHAGAAVLLTRIAARAGLGSLGRLVAGLIFVATPLAFTPLYWAAGIQELLGVILALAAVERWLAGTRRDLLLAAGLAAFSLLAKEAGLGLPVFFVIMLFVGVGPRLEDRAFGWGLCMLLMPLAVFEGVLLLNHFGTGAGEAYAMGGPLQVGANLGRMGWWLVSPGPLLSSALNPVQATAGAMVFVLWGLWGVVRYQQGRRLPLLTFLAALITLAPALPLERQLHPYLGLAALSAGALALGSVIPTRYRPGPVWLVGLGVLAAAWAFLGMEVRLKQRDAQGLPADPVVRATALSWETCRMLPQLPLEQDSPLVFLQIPMSRTQMEMARQLGPRWVAGTYLHESLGGSIGPRLILGPERSVTWVNALFETPGDALVLCEVGPGFKHWGRTPNAALYAALADVGSGNFPRARRHLVLGATLVEKTLAFAFDPDQMAVRTDVVLARKEEFIDWTAGLLDGQASVQEVGGLQDLFLNLLSTATGQSRAELEAGSTSLVEKKKIQGRQTLRPEE